MKTRMGVVSDACGLGRSSTRAGCQVVWAVVLLVVFVAMFLGLAARISRWSSQPYWLTLVSLIPAFLIFQHGVYLLRSKPKILKQAENYEEELEDRNLEQRSVSGSDAGSSAERSGTASGSGAAPGPAMWMMREYAVRKPYRKQAQAEVDRQFSLPAISLDYFLPAFLAAMTGIIPAFVLAKRATLGEGLPPEVMVGATCGMVGAFIYVLMTLGYRSFQRDVTPGAAIWCGIQLILGPILGGVAAVAMKEVQASELTREGVYVFAGLFPREIVSFIQDAARRVLGGGQAAPSAKLMTLRSVRGIDQRVEDRLLEEGITDGYLLAMADPIRLFRNTPFDLRQVVGWMDECLLRAIIPEHADALQKLAVSGAIDLAYYWEMDDGVPDKSGIENLAKLINCDAKVLLDTSRRLDEDAQVQLIWSLYQSGEQSTT